METKPEDGGGGGRQARKKKGVLLYPSGSTLATTAMQVRPSITEVKLAAIAVGLNIRLRSADMPVAMQERAFRCTRSLVDAVAANTRPNPTQIARALKKEFDGAYGVAWHCIVGKSFGSFVTHSPGGFLYFSLDNLSFLLFKTEVQPIIHSSTLSPHCKPIALK